MAQATFTLEKERFVLLAKDLIDILGLECEICKERYEMQEKTPKLLPCNHTVCLPCLERITTEQCPICRTYHNITYAQDLPTDFKVVRGLDAMKNAQKSFKNVCLQHNCQKLEKFCSTCVLPVCPDCVRLNHGDNDGHVIIEMDKALEENVSRFNDLNAKCEESLRQLKKRQEVVQNVKTSLDEKEDDLIDEVGEKFDAYSTMLSERKNSLINMIKNKVAQRKSEMDSESTRVEESTKTVKTLYDSFKTSRESSDVREMFALQKKFIEDEKELVKYFSNDGLCESYDFVALNEERFKTNLTAIGDILTKLDVNMMSP